MAAGQTPLWQQRPVMVKFLRMNIWLTNRVSRHSTFDFIELLNTRPLVLQASTAGFFGMKNELRTHLLRFLIGVPFVVAGVLFRPFWQSEWGMPTFILAFWAIMSLAAGWGGKGRRYSLRFGLTVSTALSLCFVATALSNKYVGIGLVCLLFYVAMKFKFLERRSQELGPPTEEKL